MLAPDDLHGRNKGTYTPGEHIGHLRREHSSQLAPVIDALIDSDMLRFITIECNLTDMDTNHSRKGYTLSVVVMSDSVDVAFTSMVRNLFFGIKNDCTLR